MLADGIGAAAAIGIGLGLAVAAYAAAGALAARSGTILRGLAAVIVLAWLTSALYHLLAAIGGFALLPACLGTAAIVAVAVPSAGGVDALRRRARADGAFVRRAGRRILRSRRRFVVLLFLALALPMLLRAIVVPPLGWDTLVYRGVKAAMWVQDAGSDAMIGTGPWGYYRNMLGGGEVFLAWAMLPLRADTLTGLLDVAQWLALGLATFSLAREVGAKEPLGSACAGFVLTLPTVAVLPGSGYVELVQLATAIGGLALGLRAPRAAPGLLVLAGAGLGVAASTKFPMVALGGLLLALLVGRALAGRARSFRLAALAAVVAFLAPLAPWLAVAYARTGAIFSPLPVSVGPLVLGYAAPELQWMMTRPLPEVPAVFRELAVLARVFHPPLLRSEALGLAALVPLLAAPSGIARLARFRPFAAACLAVAGFVSAALYFSPGLAPVRVYWPLSSSRFLLPVVALAAVAAVARGRPGSSPPRGLGTLLATIAIAQLAGYLGYGWSGASVIGVGLVAGIAAALVGAIAVAARLPRPAVRAGAIAASAALAIVLLGAARDRVREQAFLRDFAIHRDEKPWAAAIAAVDDPVSPRVVAVTGGPKRSMDNWFAYPFLGRRLQNRLVYVPVSADGTVLPFGEREAMEAFEAAADFGSWEHRLGERGVTEVVSFAPASLELRWMESRPGLFERIAGDGGSWGLYRLRREPAGLTAPRGTPGSSGAR